MSPRQLPNAITFARLVGCAIFALAFMAGAVRAALAIYVALEALDQLDGKLAARLDCRTVTGGYFDPFVDSVTHLTAFACLLTAGVVPLWAYLTFLVRELGVMFLRLLASVQGVRLAGSWPGKVKAAVHAVAIALGLAALGGVARAPWPPSVSVAAAVAASVLSGAYYVARHRAILARAFRED